MRGPAALYPQEDPWYSFLSEAESAPGPRIRSIEKYKDLIGIRTHKLLASSIGYEFEMMRKETVVA
jgi:hypothetical protein